MDLLRFALTPGVEWVSVLGKKAALHVLTYLNRHGELRVPDKGILAPFTDTLI